MSTHTGFVHDLLENAARNWPDDTAIETDDLSITFSQLRDLSIFYAHWLRSKGIETGHKVILQAENTVDVIPFMFAVMAVGGAFSPIHPSTPGKQRRYIAQNSEATLCIYYRNGELIADRSGTLVDIPKYNARTGVALQQDSLSTFTPGLISEALACIIYTSGSTGKPKGVTCLHRQILFAVQAVADSLDYRKDDRIFLVLPLSFDYGLYQVFLALATGATLYMADPKMAGPSLLKKLRSTGSTVLPAVPLMMDNLALLARRQKEPLKTLRLITSTGAAVAPSTVQALRQYLPNLQFQLMYGLTECKRATITPPDADLDRPNTSGLPLRDTELYILDPDGNPLPPGEVGEIVVRGQHLMAGYWKDNDQSAQRYMVRNATMRELRTGDFGWLDEDGFLYCDGRQDDIFKQRGFRVSCSEVEAAACSIEGVRHAVLVPPDGKKGSVLIVRFDREEFDVTERLREEIEGYKLPGRVEAVPCLPTTRNGKYDRQALKALAHE